MFEADVNFSASNGMSALTFAAAAGRLDMVKLLLQYRPMVRISLVFMALRLSVVV